VKTKPDKENATARFKQRRREKAIAAFAKSALEEARGHSVSAKSATKHTAPVSVSSSTAPETESWYMTHRGEWRVENEVLAYENRNETE
jgi:hypothetical protein